MSDQGSGGPQQPSDGGWQQVHNPPPPGYGAGQQPPPGYVPPGYGPPGYPPPYGSQAGLSPTAAAAISYLTFVPAIVMLVIEPYKRDNYVRFHAWQSIVLSGIWLVGSAVIESLGHMGMHWLLGLMHFFFFCVVAVFWLVAIIKASQGERYGIPIVGEIAESLTASVQI